MIGYIASFIMGVAVTVIGGIILIKYQGKLPQKPIEIRSSASKLEITGMDSLYCRAMQSPQGYILTYLLRPTLYNSGEKSTTLLSFTLEMLNYRVANKVFNLKTNDLDSGNAVTPLLYGNFREVITNKNLLPDKAKLKLSVHCAGIKKPAVAEKEIILQR